LPSLLLESLGLQETAHVIFEQSPLVLSVCQVSFANNLRITNPTLVAPFQTAIQDHYPTLAPQSHLGVEIELGNQTVKADQQAQWRFSDQTDDWAVVLATNYVAIETRTYHHFDHFLDRLRFVLQAVQEHIRPNLGTRVGLRYINEIRQGDNDWARTLNNVLLGPVAAAPFSGLVNRAIQELRIISIENQAITIRHGPFPFGAVVQPKEGRESEMEQPFYLLDFDVYRVFPPTQPLSMDPDTICIHVRDFNQVCYQLFRWATLPEYIATLEERRDAE
jgi:uncharacterized protein (TIGR04255 family)